MRERTPHEQEVERVRGYVRNPTLFLRRKKKAE